MKGDGIQVVAGPRPLHRPEHAAGRGRRGGHLQERRHRDRLAPVRPPIPGIDHARCLDSTGLLEIDHVPERLVVLGGGVIGCEFASIFAHFGSEVTIVEMLDT